ncbi:hypothetical protein BDW59DRAFT_35310 [Aspergillus cavernicola]|uniref:Clr5 domain-containing protein n=1 Tax=Aspergillus cavernicola TaxID=176166 RepID=A0ABR4HC53_9EURO
MKCAISPDIWETKRMLITKLYKDEEWPLKQVIKLVQTRDFHPSESQLRSRLKKWHITKPSRKKYDGSRRLSGTKKNQEPKRPTQQPWNLPSATTYNTLPSHPIPLRRTDESDAYSEVSVSVPEMSTSPTDHYILPSSPLHEDHRHSLTMSPLYASNSIPTPITPAFYGMEDSKHAPSDPGHSLYFCPPEFTTPAPYPQPQAQFGSFSNPNPNTISTDYMGYPGVHYISAHSYPQPSKDHPGDGPFVMPDLPPPLLDRSWAFQCQPPSPTEVYPPPQSHYLQEDCMVMQPLVYPTM